MILDFDKSAETVAELVCKRVTREVEASDTRPALVDGDELARLLSVSRPTVDRLRRDGVIPSVSLGPKCRRYNVQRVIEQLEEHHAID